MVTRLAFFTEGNAESQTRREKINKNFLLRKSVVEILQNLHGSQSPIHNNTLYQMAIRDVTGDPPFATSKKIAKFFMSLGFGTHPNRHNEDTEKFWQVLCDHLRPYYHDRFENLDQDCSNPNIGRHTTAILQDAMFKVLPAMLSATEELDPALSNFFQFAAPMFLGTSQMSFDEAIQHGQPILLETEQFFLDEFNKRTDNNASNFDEMFEIECRKDASKFALDWLEKPFSAKAFLQELPKMHFFDQFYRFVEEDISQDHLDSPFVKIFDLLIADYVSADREKLWKHSAEFNYGYAIQSLEEHATRNMFTRIKTGAKVLKCLEHILDGFVESTKELTALRDILPWVFFGDTDALFTFAKANGIEKEGQLQQSSVLQGFVKAIAVHLKLNNPELIEIRLSLAGYLNAYPTPEEIDLVYDEELLQTVYDIFDYSLEQCLEKVKLLRNARNPDGKQKNLPILGLGFKGPKFEEEPTATANTIFLNFTSVMRSNPNGVIGTPLLFAVEYYVKRAKTYDFNIEVLDNASLESLSAYNYITHKIVDLCTSPDFKPHPSFSKMFLEAIIGRVKGKLAVLENQNEVNEKEEELCKSILKKYCGVSGTSDFSQNLSPETVSKSLPKFPAKTEANTKLATDPDLIPNYTKYVGKFFAEEIAKYLWLDPEASLSEFVQKVNEVAVYLKDQGFELRGVKADGNCFCCAFLKSYYTLTQKISILDDQEDKISYLRGLIASQYRAIHREAEVTGIARAQQIETDKEWITASGEGDLLAKVLDIPIRVVTVIQQDGRCHIDDMLTFPEKESQIWATISELEKPKEYILIVDLGGHFICAQKIGRVAESSRNSPDTRFLTYQQDLPLLNTEQNNLVHQIIDEGKRRVCIEPIVNLAAGNGLSLSFAMGKGAGEPITMEKQPYALGARQLIQPCITRCQIFSAAHRLWAELTYFPDVQEAHERLVKKGEKGLSKMFV